MTIKNGREYPDGSEVFKQVCVIGTGPAGVTVAWELYKKGISVVLIEGSRFYESYRDSWPDKVLLYNGEAEGLFKTNERDFLILPYVDHQDPAWERERTYGGTGAHWGGQSRPFDPIDFEERPGFPGWPINRNDLDPYYAKASVLCRLHGDYKEHGHNFTTEYWAEQLKVPPPLPAVEGFDVEMYQYLGSDFLNFATREFEPGVTIGDTDVLVIQNASLLDINHQQGRVTSLTVASMDDGLTPHKDTVFTIKANVYVLACGAVANARQLLLSKAGNDRVGKNFMCHPLSRGPVVSTRGYLTLDQSRLLNGTYVTGAPWKDENQVRVSGRFIPNAAETKRLGTGRCWFWYTWGQYYFEMTPNDGSYITLSDTVDPVFRQQQTRITWDIRKEDEDTYNKTIESYRTSIRKLGGDITNFEWKYVRSQLIVNGHHLGTTRMANDPAKGAVDKNLKLFGIDNLFVAGSSVFPSAGISNPTFTIIALSIRLAEHLAGKVR